MTRLSRAHWRVQAQIASCGWVTQCWAPTLPKAIEEANDRADLFDVPARVLLGETVYYCTGAREATA
jgi:hypothetical protein